MNPPVFAPVFKKDEAPGLHGIPSFYPTPSETAGLLFQVIPVYPGDIILEPSAGDGSIARLIQQLFPRNPLWVIEKNPDLRATLHAYKVVGSDFLLWKGEVDVIIGNPPFSNGYQDIDHFVHAWKQLRRGGRISMLVHYYSAYREDRTKPAQFIKWFRSVGIQRALLENAFVTSRASSQVKVALLWGTKP